MLMVRYKMKMIVLLVAAMWTTPCHPFRISVVGGHKHARPRTLISCCSSQASDGSMPLPVDPTAGHRSRTVFFSPSDLHDLRRVEVMLEDTQGACVVVIPSWRHHPLQYDCLAAALGALHIPTVVSSLPDGLWAFLLERLKVNNLRRAARKGVLKLTIKDALVPLFSRLDTALREHSNRHPGRRMMVIASDDSAWLVRAFVNSLSTKWLSEVPLETAVLVGGYHKSIVGELALDVYPHRPQTTRGNNERVVRYFSLNGREGRRAGVYSKAFDLEADIDMDPSISCMSFEEDSESCVLQEYEVADQRSLSLLGSTSLLSLWVPRVLRG